MKRFAAVVMACLALAACTTTSVKRVGEESLVKAEQDSKGVLVQPDVQLSLLTASGIPEAREDWSRSAQANLAAAIREELAQRHHPFQDLDPETAMGGRAGQLLRLHDAVGTAIMTFEYSGLRLPSKPKDKFDWTLGDGTKVLRESLGADHALFVTARGSYASAGRKAVMIGAAMLGVSVPLGSQQMFASLVDLRTGNVIWFNVAVAGPSDDMRSPEGARSLVKTLLQKAPI